MTNAQRDVFRKKRVLEHALLRPNTFSTRCVAIATPVNMPQPRIPCTEPQGFDPFERSEPALDRSQVPTRPHPQFQSRYHPESAR